MKPNRFLTVPSAPRYVDEEGCAAGQIPELRIPKLLKTGRFLSFLRAKNEDGSWVWLKPEVKEGDAVNQDSIRTDLILSQEEERRRRQLNENLEAAREDESGEKAFKLYQLYLPRKIKLEDEEDVAEKFLNIAASKGHAEARKIADVVRLGANGLTDLESAKLRDELAARGAINPAKAVRFISRAKSLGITIEKCDPWAGIGADQFAREWCVRARARKEIVGGLCCNGRVGRMLCDVPQYPKYSDYVPAVWKILKQVDPVDIDETNMICAVAFFVGMVGYCPPTRENSFWNPYNQNAQKDKDEYKDARVIGAACRKWLKTQEA